MKKTTLAGMWLTLLIALTITGCAASPGFLQPDDMRPLSDRFTPGFIVSDEAFFDSAAMTEQQIQRFIESVPCTPSDSVSPCLARYTQDTPSEESVAPGHCQGYTGATREPASRIIKKVAVSCGISPRTLLVLVQKEQSLLTEPSTYGYQRATGYACPDTAACDTQYFGFFNQVYNAAWQFRQYTEKPDRAYKIGTVTVRYNPDASCGASPVTIANQATANLYNYTPYQPNAATLANHDTTDPCAAFGNLNFWILWNRWFGDPRVEQLAGFLPCTRWVGGHPCRWGQR